MLSAGSVFAELCETMILVLLAAAALTAVTGDLTDCAVIRCSGRFPQSPISAGRRPFPRRSSSS